MCLSVIKRCLGLPWMTYCLYRLCLMDLGGRKLLGTTPRKDQTRSEVEGAPLDLHTLGPSRNSPGLNSDYVSVEPLSVSLGAQLSTKITFPFRFVRRPFRSVVANSKILAKCSS